MAFPVRRSHLAVVEGAEQDRLTVGSYLEEWLWGKQSLRPSTHVSYETHVRRYLNPYLGALHLDALSPVHVNRMYRELAMKDDLRGRPLSVATLRRIHATLTSA